MTRTKATLSLDNAVARAEDILKAAYTNADPEVIRFFLMGLATPSEDGEDDESPDEIDHQED